jgi:hypothetical protein
MGNEDEIAERVEELLKLKEHTNSKEETQFATERIASLTGGVGVIYVGGNTDMEQKELYIILEHMEILETKWFQMLTCLLILAQL